MECAEYKLDYMARGAEGVEEKSRESGGRQEYNAKSYRWNGDCAGGSGV